MKAHTCLCLQAFLSRGLVCLNALFNAPSRVPSGIPTARAAASWLCMKAVTRCLHANRMLYRFPPFLPEGTQRKPSPKHAFRHSTFRVEPSGSLQALSAHIVRVVHLQLSLINKNLLFHPLRSSRSSTSAPRKSAASFYQKATTNSTKLNHDTASFLV